MRHAAILVAAVVLLAGCPRGGGETTPTRPATPKEVVAGARATIEQWRQAYQQAGSGELSALRSADPELVEQDSAILGAALSRVFDELPEGGRALVVGHSPTNEAAVLGLTGEIVAPMSKGAGVLLVHDAGETRVEPLA